MRTLVRWGSVVLAAVGWSAAFVLGVMHGADAGINTWFIAALSVGIAATILAGQLAHFPTRAELDAEAKLYALGYREGLGCGACPLRPEPGSEADRKRLELVKR
jgi:hypothetical protein